ncbi:MAG: hypothetical protein QOK42_1530, partial [Frankiaceae bacterium]|nr:hypothetical protein [Frankiaceae bacterium]
WQQDAMQADVSSPNPNGDDKMIDSTGVYNIYYVCEGAYGGNSVVRSPSPSMVSAMQNLAIADGAVGAATASTSGYDELSTVFTNDFGKNSNPAYTDGLGHFTCT